MKGDLGQSRVPGWRRRGNGKISSETGSFWLPPYKYKRVSNGECFCRENGVFLAGGDDVTLDRVEEEVGYASMTNDV